MTSGNRIGVALIGHGVSGAYLHGPLIEAVPELCIRVVCTSRPDSLRLRREPVRCVSSAEQACRDAAIELVVIASPHASHFALARSALRAGKHVVVDKPLTLAAAEADELIALAREQRRLLSVFHNRRWDGDFLEVQRQLQHQRLGALTRFEACWDRFRPQIAPAWRYSDAPGAGLLWDLGPHLVDQALCLFGWPQRWQAEIGRQRDGAVSDDYFALTFWYGAQRRVLSASLLIEPPRPRFAAFGTAGSLLTFGVDGYEAALRAGGRPDAAGFRSQLADTHAVSTLADERHEFSLAAGHWELFYPDVLQALRAGRPPAVQAEEARDVVALIERAHADGACR